MTSTNENNALKFEPKFLGLVKQVVMMLSNMKIAMTKT